jgi:hypothetical protein
MSNRAWIAARSARRRHAARAAERLVDDVEQGLVADRLLEEVHRAALQRPDAGPDVGVAGEEDDGKVPSRAREGVLHVEPAGAGKAEIQEDARRSVGRPAGEEVVGRCEQRDVESVSRQEPVQAPAHGLVVVHDEHDRAAARRLASGEVPHGTLPSAPRVCSRLSASPVDVLSIGSASIHRYRFRDPAGDTQDATAAAREA